MFMSDAPLTAEPGAAPGPQDQAGNRYRLLGLVRRIIDYGRDLVASMQRQNTPTAATPTARRFGTVNLTLIIARITRGLQLAAGLEARLLRARPQPVDQRAKPVRAAAPGKQRHPRAPEPTQAEDDAALLRGLPSAEEIAARVRSRRPGAVIVEICRDLGIDTTHELWPEIRNAIIEYDGSLVRMLRVWFGRVSAFLDTLPPEVRTARFPSPLPPDWNGPLLAGTGPP